MSFLFEEWLVWIRSNLQIQPSRTATLKRARDYYDASGTYSYLLLYCPTVYNCPTKWSLPNEQPGSHDPSLASSWSCSEPSAFKLSTEWAVKVLCAGNGNLAIPKQWESPPC